MRIKNNGREEIKATVFGVRLNPGWNDITLNIPEMNAMRKAIMKAMIKGNHLEVPEFDVSCLEPVTPSAKIDKAVDEAYPMPKEPEPQPEAVVEDGPSVDRSFKRPRKN